MPKNHVIPGWKSLLSKTQAAEKRGRYKFVNVSAFHTASTTAFVDIWPIDVLGAVRPEFFKASSIHNSETLSNQRYTELAYDLDAARAAFRYIEIGFVSRFPPDLSFPHV